MMPYSFILAEVEAEMKRLKRESETGMM